MKQLDPELVSAGAGTGKTYDIVQRIAGAIEKGAAIERISAITFTNKAAAELQQRLKKELQKRELHDAARKVDAAYVSTIHAFCLRLISEHPVESDVTPETRQIDERETDTLLASALAEAMSDDSQVAEDVRFVTRECLKYSKASEEDQLRAKVLNLIKKARAIAKGPDDMEALATSNQKDLQSRLPKALDQAGLRKFLDPQLRKYSAWWSKNGAQAKFPKPLAGNHGQIEPLLKGGPVALGELWECSLGVARNKKWEEYDAIVEPLRDAITAAIPQHPDWQAWYHRYARSLFRIAAAALKSYEVLKRTLNVMDYSDMQTAALAMMRREVAGRPFAEYLRARFDLLVVDEFQDTSPLQFAIAEELRGAAVQGRYVGDLKQAIYGWRDADSCLFQSLLAGSERVETLKENRRSRKALVDFFNAIFPPLMKRAGMDYDIVKAKSVYAEEAIPAYAAEITVLDGDSSKDKTAARVALWLKVLVDDPSQQVYDRDARGTRRLRPGDIAVLTRTNAEAETLAAALSERSLRSSQTAKGLALRPEVQLFRALMAAFSSPENGLSMAAALASEVYGLSHAALHTMADLLRSPRSFYANDELRSRLEHELKPQEWRALTRFFSHLDDLHERFRREPLSGVVDRLFEVTRLRDRFAGKQEGRLCLACLERCRDSVRAYASLTPDQLSYMSISGHDVEGFLAYFDQTVASEDEHLVQTRPTDEDAVQIMTIHKAKGLEFAVTVLFSLDAGVLPRFDRIEMVRPEGVLGAGMLEKARIRCFPGSHRPVPEEPFLKDAMPDAIADAARNLYVAMTRAKERLVLVWPSKAGEDRYIDLLAEAGLRREGDHLAVGGKKLAVETAEVPDAPTVAAPQVVTHRETALATQDAKAFKFAEFPERNRGAWPHISPTMLCRWFDCPLTYYLEDLCRLEHRGIALDRASMDVRVDPLPGVNGAAPQVDGRTDLGDMLHRALAAPGFEVSEVLARLEKLAGPKVRAYAERVLGPIREHFQSLRPSGEILSEHPFLFKAGESVVSGVIDTCIPTAGGLWIYDLKTNDIKAEDVPRYAQYYAPQLYTYSLGTARTMPVKVAGLRLIFTTPGVVATLLPCPPDFESAVTAAANLIAQGPPFEKHPARVCRTCPYVKHCPVGSQQVTVLSN